MHVVGVIHRSEGRIDLGQHVVPLRDGSGKVCAYGLAIPFLRAADLPVLGQDEEELGPPVVRATRRLYAETVAAARVRILHQFPGLEGAGKCSLIATRYVEMTYCARPTAKANS